MCSDKEHYVKIANKHVKRVAHYNVTIIRYPNINGHNHYIITVKIYFYIQDKLKKT